MSEKEKEETETPLPVLRYDGRRLSGTDHFPVREFPIALTVNGIELATLIASPHDLVYLVAGFLRMQGLVKRADDLLALSVCGDFGAATVRIRGEVPSRLTPTLTSGCGAGISFKLQQPLPRNDRAAAKEERIYSPADVFTMMNELARRAENYRSHGGIHSAAVGDGRTVLLHAEDIGRHNTLDRIAGEALLKNIDLSGMILVTSGRISSELVSKAVSLGIVLIASRTSPTDLAVRLAREHGIALIGYARGGKFNLYAGPERLAFPPEEVRIDGVTGVILAGGASSRMGSNKALLPYQGGRFVEAIHRQMASLFRNVLIVTNTPQLFDFLPCPKVKDLIPGMGALSGIHSGLFHSQDPRVFVAACDMPNLNPGLIRHLASLADENDVVVPEGTKGLEPLHAVYGKSALPAIEDALHAGKGRVVSFFDKVKVRKVSAGEVSRLDPDFRSFRNINTPEEYFRFREEGKPAQSAEHGKPHTGKDGG
ncbi:MAG: formate dehydrogenase accessory sulfurtransferase FdhD [Deltaproteobacteria bacterium]|nr:formate dehydrogenase accessory sulfurtransferase FdhD [Deltaproteobacteria bacterium]